MIWAGGGNPLDKLLDLDPGRYGIELSTGGNILPALAAYKRFPGMEGAAYYYYGIPKNPVNDWLVAEHQKRFNAPPDFFTAGGFSAAMAVVRRSRRPSRPIREKLIAAMEGMEFDTPKGKMIFRKEDHQALQSMYHFKIRVDPGARLGGAGAGPRIEDRGHGHPDPQQAVRRRERQRPSAWREKAACVSRPDEGHRRDGARQAPWLRRAGQPPSSVAREATFSRKGRRAPRRDIMTASLETETSRSGSAAMSPSTPCPARFVRAS